MQAKSRILKSRRREIFRSWLPDLLPPCRHCLPTLADCSCPHDPCNCEMEIEVIDPVTEEPCQHSWPDDEATAYFDLLGRVLASLDPTNYAEPPAPTVPIATISAALRLATMESRYASGQHLYHPNDRSADVGREGELIVMADNGVKKRSGVGHVEESKHEARWAEKIEKKAHRVHAQIG